MVKALTLGADTTTMRKTIIAALVVVLALTACGSERTENEQLAYDIGWEMCTGANASPGNRRDSLVELGAPANSDDETLARTVAIAAYPDDEIRQPAAYDGCTAALKGE